MGTETVNKAWRASDGKLYQIPSYGVNRDVNHGMLYRKDIFDKHGIKMWNNPEEFYQVLKQLKELYPSFDETEAINSFVYALNRTLPVLNWISSIE